MISGNYEGGRRIIPPNYFRLHFFNSAPLASRPRGWTIICKGNLNEHRSIGNRISA